MVNRKHVCKACEGSGLLLDDEEWRYTCRICGGDGVRYPSDPADPELRDVDENNRILD